MPSIYYLLKQPRLVYIMDLMGRLQAAMGNVKNDRKDTVILIIIGCVGYLEFGSLIWLMFWLSG